MNYSHSETNTCCMASWVDVGCVERPSSMWNQHTRLAQTCKVDSLKLVILPHFATISSGVYGLIVGKPYPPARCHRVCAAQPPRTSNNDPDVSTLSKILVLISHPSAWRMLLTRATQVTNQGRDEIRLSSNINFEGKYEVLELTLKASTISCGLFE